MCDSILLRFFFFFREVHLSIIHKYENMWAKYDRDQLHLTLVNFKYLIHNLRFRDDVAETCSTKSNSIFELKAVDDDSV